MKRLMVLLLALGCREANADDRAQQLADCQFRGAASESYLAGFDLCLRERYRWAAWEVDRHVSLEASQRRVDSLEGEALRKMAELDSLIAETERLVYQARRLQ